MKVYHYDAALNHGIKYIAVDTSGVLENMLEPLLSSLRRWTAANGYELLIDTYDGLVESGLIAPMPDSAGFRDGILFSFDDMWHNADAFMVQATKYRSPRGAVGANFTARFAGWQWVVDEPDSWFIS